MSRTPNAEQLLAIRHQGGVLLKAGAGSGKTFVLVEHIIYRVGEWIKEYKKEPQGTFEDFIRQQLGSVVMMTFTKKAAGEMNIRVADRFEDQVKMVEEDQEYWQIAHEALPMLTVTTIDGFCRRLITSGYFPHLSTEAKVIFRTERLDQVKILFEKWFVKKGQELEGELLEVLIREKGQLLKAFSDVFSDPGQRILWKNFSLQSIHPEKLGKTLESSFYLKKVDEALLKIENLDLPGDDLSSFEKHVSNIKALGLPVVKSPETISLYCSFFGTISSLRKETAKKSTPAHVMAYEGMVDLRKWCREWEPLIQTYQENFESRILPWMRICKDLFTSIDEQLDPNQGLTFSDIEYHVALGLESEECRRLIQDTFRNFIVDEFQDTSSLQFQIIRSLIENDFHKLFCVGDPKQAIYGFRGGELSVFQQCSELIPKVLTLANNYRSLPEVINFNNSLFECVLPLGVNFTGKDSFTVAAEGQNVPEEVQRTEAGEIEILSLSLTKTSEEDLSLNFEQVNRLEAKYLVQAIEKQRNAKPDETCTVLYRKLGPSGELIRGLINRKIGFTAQFKIELLDDPVMGIFLVLLKRSFDRNERTRNNTPEFIIENYLSILGVESTKQFDFAAFENDVKYWGLFEAYKKFLFRLGLTNENSDVNLDLIETLCRLYQQDPETILIQLAGNDNPKVSLDFRFGLNANKVQIMTAHASKGLEFDTVYLGGIYTNGYEMGDKDLFGKQPDSFSWYLDLRLRDKQKSPFYKLESEIKSFKVFSESKRLFYVACTRAQKKLSWVKLENVEELSSLPKSSWFHGLNSWQESAAGSQMHHLLIVSDLGELSVESLQEEKASPELPLFFFDPVGVHTKSEAPTELLIAAELSVTRLNSLVDCPRKFYLENILKLTPSKEVSVSAKKEEDRDMEEVVVSSSERGTYIHAQLSHAIGHNFVVPRQAMQFEKPMEWALDQLRPLRDDYRFISESPLKFRFYNFMISGTPDLYLLPKKSENLAQIWDFKTGRITPAALDHYWVQLKAYAYALYSLGLVDRLHSIETKLCFVDQEKLLSETVTWEMVNTELFTLWRLQNEPWKAKTDHCSQCSYGDICPR